MLGFLRHFRFLWSLKFAVVVMTTLTAALAAATIVESKYDTATAQYFIYEALWFQIVLALLGVNIIAVAFSRWPWNLRHIPFLTAHLGIVLLLVGAYLSQHHGIDGMIELREGQTSGVIELPKLAVVVADQKEEGKVVSVSWNPPSVTFKPMDLPGGLRIAEFVTHAELRKEIREVPSRALASVSSDSAEGAIAPALVIHVKSARMKLSRAIWLWEGDASWSLYSEGPLNLRLLRDQERFTVPPRPVEGVPLTAFLELKREGAHWKTLAYDSKGVVRRSEIAVGEVFRPGWLDFEITVERVVEKAALVSRYVPAEKQYGDDAAPPAIRIEDEEGVSLWLAQGQSRAWKGRELAFLKRKIRLPVELELVDFRADFEHGSEVARNYTSIVRVHEEGSEPRLASLEMNRPLEISPYTFYQTGFKSLSEDLQLSVLSVNRDPGRELKYTGSLLIVLGSALLFLRRWWENRLRTRQRV